ALAALGALVDDDFLLGDPARTGQLLEAGRAQAVRFAALNPVQGRPLALDPNPVNRPGGDVVFGAVEAPLSRTLVAAGNVADPDNIALTRLNAVRVLVRRTKATGNPARTLLGFGFGVRTADVLAQSVATFDRDVYGFRPAGGQPVPLAPFALRSDPAG